MIHHYSLQASETRYRRLFETAQDGILILNAKTGEIEDVNPYMLAMLHYSYEEFIGMKLWEVSPFKDTVLNQDAFHELQDKGYIRYSDLPLETKEGKPIAVEFVSNVYKANGDLVIQCNIRNVTEHRQAAEALRESEETAKRLAQEHDLMAEIGRIIGSTLNIEEVYERFAEKVKEVIPFDAITINRINSRDNTRAIQHHSGIPIQGRKIGDVVPLDGSISQMCVRTRSSVLLNVKDNDELLRQYPGISLAVEAGIQSRILIPLFSKDEVIGTLLLRSVTPDAYTERDLRLAERVGSQIAGAVANAQLFLELKRMETELRASEEKYRSLTSLADWSFVVDKDRRYLFANENFLNKFGPLKDSVLGRKYDEFHDEESTRIFADAVKYVFETGNHYQDEYWSARESMHFLRTFSVVKKIEGSITAVTVASKDITEIKRMKKELEESEKRYRELSIIDDLTQIYNSRYFYNQLKMEIDRANRYEQPLTLLLLDLDNFKAYNDTYGHVEGDQVLLRLGQVIKRCLRNTDSAYRYGGEEFTVILPMTKSDEGRVTAERIRTIFKKEIFSPDPGKSVNMTMSIGVAQYRTDEDTKAFVQRVDQLMYQAKKSGKDRVCFEP